MELIAASHTKRTQKTVSQFPRIKNIMAKQDTPETMKQCMFALAQHVDTSHRTTIRYERNCL